MRRAVTMLCWLLVGAACPIAAAAASTLEKIGATGTIVLGFRDASPPFSFRDANGKPAGYSIDLCNRIAAAVKERLSLPRLEVRYVRVTPEDRIAKLVSGEIDLECGSTTRTISRQAQVDFTLLTFVTGTELLVPLGSNIDDLSGLEGRKIALLPGTTNDAVIRSALASRMVNAELVSVADHDAGVAAVESGRVDAYASDEVLLIGLARKVKDPSKLRLTGKLYSYEPYALMVRQNDAEFRYIADRTLAGLFRTREIGDIYRRWFGDWNAGPSQILIALYMLQSVPE
jgi:glutamate/aspartate transport system substrate-binding protein